MKLYADDALVIRAKDYGEADKILTLYTLQHGKLCAVAKGVRKPAAGMRGGVQLFSHTRLMLYRGKTMDTVTQAETKDAFNGLRDNLTCLTYASYVAELLDMSVTEREPHPEIFLLTLVCLGLLMGEDPELVIRLFETRLLQLIGYQPQLDCCQICQKPLGPGKYQLSGEAGGIICDRCYSAGEGIWISAGTVAVMGKLLSVDPKQVFRLKLSVQNRTELDQTLGRYLEYHLGKPIKSRQVIRDIIY